MLRTVPLALLALLVLPSAGAVVGAPHGIAIGPDGLARPYQGDPYFLWVRASNPELHDNASEEDDCGAGEERPDARQAVLALVDPFTTWDPTEYLSLSAVFPQCIAAQVSAPCGSIIPACPPPLPGRAYAAYDVGTGDFYAEAALDPAGSTLPFGLGMILWPDAQSAEEELVVGGNSGVSVLADCEYCPTPP